MFRLTPAAVGVRESTSGAVHVKVGDWNTLGVLAGGSSPGSPDGVRAEPTALTRLMSMADRRAAADVDARRAEAFQAPEGVWTPEVDRVRLDVFALGAPTYYLVAGRPPAADQAALRERLLREQGLDLAVDVPQVPTALRELVLRATRPQVTARLADVRSFLELLADAEGAMARPEDLDQVDPREDVVLASPRHARRPQGAFHRLPACRPGKRPDSSAGLGRLGPRAAGARIIRRHRRA